MFTVSQYVWNILSKDNIATEYLKNGLLNTTAYAKTILPEIEKQTLAKISVGSVVTSLIRIKGKLDSKVTTSPKFKIDDISLKLPISELVYKKSFNPNPQFSQIYLNLKAIGSIHFNIVNVEDELDIFVSTSQLQIVQNQMTNLELILKEDNLCALVLKYNPEFRNYPGMGSQVLNVLAINSIIFVECLTTYSEFIIYIKQDFANTAVEVLKKTFIS